MLPAVLYCMPQSKHRFSSVSFSGGSRILTTFDFKNETEQLSAVSAPLFIQFGPQLKIVLGILQAEYLKHKQQVSNGNK